MPTVDFIYDLECPNVKSTRANLMRAFSRAEVPARWSEFEIGDADSPERVRGFGSPTILVDGRDIAGARPESARCCRIYDGAGVPPVALIASALARTSSPESDGVREAPRSTRPRGGGWRTSAAVLPGLGVALLPKIACPFCWPVYMGILSATGLTFLMEDRWLLPISVVLLSAALFALVWRADGRHGRGPAVVGTVAAVSILVGKFAFESDVAVYGGIGVLFLACVWNAWPRRSSAPACSACHETATG